MKVILLIAIVIMIARNNGVHASLKINEIYPAPSAGNQELVEIYNEGDAEIDLSGYTITDSINNPLTFETNHASASGYIVAFGNNVLNNSGDTIVIKNASGETVDSIEYSLSFSSDKSYSRCSDVWRQTTIISIRDSNTEACTLPTAIPTTVMVATATQSPTASMPIYNNIHISEVMVAPSEENEWVELYNDNDFSVSLKNWFIDDAENAGSNPKSFSIEIGAKSYGVYELGSSIFNNDTDAVRLLDHNNNVKDSLLYHSSVTGLTLSKSGISDKSICVTNPTKGEKNGSCINTNSSKNPSPAPSPASTVSIAEISPNESTASSDTITRVPSEKKLIRPTVLLPQSLFETHIGDNPKEIEDNKGTVLGTQTILQDKPPDSRPLWKILSLLALLFSFLTILKIFFRIKYKNAG